ncbi:MAG: ribose 5-phosphate isomerase B [Planctomycetota bacterium]
MRVALGADHAGFRFKEEIARRLRELGHVVEDCGCHGEESCDYPDFGAAAARAVAEGRAERGIVVCGTGIGIGMAANKVPGVRAAVVHDRFTAAMSREHNDANVLCLGARVLDPRHAVELAEYWIGLAFQGGRHEARVRKLEALDGPRA